MAKRKTRRTKEKKREYTNELVGIFLILLAILGIGKYGPVGRLIASFCLFLMGSLYFFLLCFLLVLGIYMIVKRKDFNFFSTKMIGLYIFIIGILVFMHETYVLKEIDTTKILSSSLDNVMDGIGKIMDGNIKTGIYNKALSNCGGGMLGALFASLFYNLFDLEGTTIVVWVLLIAGVLIFTGFSIFDFIKNSYNKGKEAISNQINKEKEVSSEKLEHDTKPMINDNTIDHRKVVQDLSELTKINDNSVASTKEEPKKVFEVVENKSYMLPTLEILKKPVRQKNETDKAAIENNINILEKVLRDFGIIGKVVEVNIGPTVTQYELELNSGTKVSRLLGINREISLALAKKDVRIQAPIPGKSTVGIEMSNEKPQMVSLRETLEAMPKDNKNVLSVALGKDIMGKVAYCDVDKTPHMLVAGATGSGKSVCINCIILSILMRAKPDEVKFIMVDPKKVELGVFNGIPHLVTPVVTDPRKASLALKKAVSEMERRYELFEECKTKNITSYNNMIEEKNKHLPDDEKLKKMPYWVVIVDELADLMLVARKEVEDSIMRITQMARAAGIHLIIATQRPSVDVVTGIIKANIPSRISFAVSSSTDSRTILDMIGAEKLLGKGDMLFLPMGESIPKRIQGAFVSEEEIKVVVDYVCDQQKASYDENFLAEEVDSEIKSGEAHGGDVEEYDDPLYNDIVEFVVTSGKASASLLQRRFKLGYNRAARIIDLLEERGIIGPQNGSKPREVLVTLDDKE